MTILYWMHGLKQVCVCARAHTLSTDTYIQPYAHPYTHTHTHTHTFSLSLSLSLFYLSPCFQCKIIIYYHTYDTNISLFPLFSLSLSLFSLRTTNRIEEPLFESGKQYQCPDTLWPMHLGLFESGSEIPVTVNTVRAVFCSNCVSPGVVGPFAQGDRNKANWF